MHQLGRKEMAILVANHLIREFTVQELKQYAFDRLVDELCEDGLRLNRLFSDINIQIEHKRREWENDDGA